MCADDAVSALGLGRVGLNKLERVFLLRVLGAAEGHKPEQEGKVLTLTSFSVHTHSLSEEHCTRLHYCLCPFRPRARGSLRTERGRISAINPRNRSDHSHPQGG